MTAVDRLVAKLADPTEAAPVDRLEVKLARVQVDPYLRKTKDGKIVPVAGHVRVMDTGPTITKVLSVVDTREWDDNQEPPKPIPGSGDPRQCDRCTRTHEVHVNVQLDTGAEACIGSGCARQNEMGMVRKAVASAANVDRRTKQLAKDEKLLGQARVVQAEVDALPLPEIVDEGRDALGTRWAMGAVHVWQHDEGPISDERRAALEGSWREDQYKARMAKLGLKPDPVWRLSDRAEDTRKLLTRAQKALEKATQGSDAPPSDWRKRLMQQATEMDRTEPPRRRGRKGW